MVNRLQRFLPHVVENGIGRSGGPAGHADASPEMRRRADTLLCRPACSRTPSQ